jgi:hypothetical protein
MKLNKLTIRRIESAFFGFFTAVGIVAVVDSSVLPINRVLAGILVILFGASFIKSLIKLHRKELD